MLNRVMSSLLIVLLAATTSLALGGCRNKKIDADVEIHKQIDVEETVETRMKVD